MKKLFLVVFICFIISMTPVYAAADATQIVSLKWIVPPESARALAHVYYVESVNYTVIGRTNGSDVDIVIESYNGLGALVNRRYFTCGNLTAYSFITSIYEHTFDLIGVNHDNTTSVVYLDMYDAALGDIGEITIVVNNTIIVVNVTAIEYIYVNTTIYENVTITEYINGTVLDPITITKVVTIYEDVYILTPIVAGLMAVCAVCMLIIYFHSERERAKRRKSIPWVRPDPRV